MSEIRVNNITNRDGTAGPSIAGIPVVDSNSHFVVPTGRTGQRYVDGGENIVRDGLVLHLDAKYSYPSKTGIGTTTSGAAATPGSSLEGEPYTWYDMSGYENHGQLLNGVGYNATNGGSLVFNGVNSAVPLRFVEQNPFRSNFTVDVFFYVSEASRTNPILRQDASTTAPNTFYINYPSFNNLSFTIVDSTGTQIGILRGGLSTNIWYHICMTIDFNALKLTSYLNGVPLTLSLSGSSGFNLSSNYYIGDSRGFDSGSRATLLGGISSTKVYNRALTAAEVSQNFEALRSRFGI